MNAPLSLNDAKDLLSLVRGVSPGVQGDDAALHLGVRDLSGSQNNTTNPVFGAANEQFIRLTEARFGAVAPALGTAKTGENGSTDTAFATATQQIAVGATGLTVAKLRTARKILKANEVDVMNDPLYIAVTAQQVDDLLGTTEVTSADYNSIEALVQGDIDSFMGFKFVNIGRLGLDGSGDRRCFAWAKSGMHVGMWNDINTKITERADKSYATQVYVKGTFGATRTDEKKVVEIICNL